MSSHGPGRLSQAASLHFSAHAARWAARECCHLIRSGWMKATPSSTWNRPWAPNNGMTCSGISGSGEPKSSTSMATSPRRPTSSHASPQNVRRASGVVASGQLPSAPARYASRTTGWPHRWSPTSGLTWNSINGSAGGPTWPGFHAGSTKVWPSWWPAKPDIRKRTGARFRHAEYPPRIGRAGFAQRLERRPHQVR